MDCINFSVLMQIYSKSTLNNLQQAKIRLKLTNFDNMSKKFEDLSLELIPKTF
jgi:hypothetical protein